MLQECDIIYHVCHISCLLFLHHEGQAEVVIFHERSVHHHLYGKGFNAHFHNLLY